jgi:Domain of unknown function (DUF5666)
MNRHHLMRPFRSLLLATCTAGLLACGQPGTGRRTPERPLGPGAAACQVASKVNPLAAAPGLGGTGQPLRGADPGGMGGTGAVARQGSNGLGGTGAVAAGEGGLGGTGIVGVITGFASICVNGVEITYEPQEPVQRNGDTVPLSELAVGQWVALQVAGQGDRLQARRIAALDTAVGPITAIDAAQSRFEVMGQPAVALEAGDLIGLRVGDWVRVSGQRLASAEIRASRVQRASEGRALVQGPWGVDRWGEAQVGGTPVNMTARVSGLAPAIGTEVRVRGVWVGGRLSADEVQAHPTRGLVGGARRVLLQGYVHSLHGRELGLGFETLTLGDGAQVEGGRLESLAVNQPVLAHGRIDAQQRVWVDRLEIRREGRRGELETRTVVRPQAASTDASPTGAVNTVDDSRGRSGGSVSSGSGGGNRGSGSGNSGSGSSGSGKSGSGKGGSGSSGSGSSGSGSSGSGSSGSGSSGSGSSGSGSSGSGSSGSGSSGSGSSGSGSSGSGSSGSGSSGSGSSGSGSSGKGSGGSSGSGSGRGR